MHRFFLPLAGLVALGTPVFAAEPLDGYFIALESCEAYQSKNKQTNPGDIHTEPMRAYDMIAINKPGGDFFQLRVPGAPVTQDRWVFAGCGVHAVVTDTAQPGPGPLPPVTPPTGAVESTNNLMALSWQPAFCETKPGKVECQQLNDGLLPITETQLSVHGLWPQPRGNDYCGVSAEVERLDKARQWAALPAPRADRRHGRGAGRRHARHGQLSGPARMDQARHLFPRRRRGPRNIMPTRCW